MAKIGLRKSTGEAAGTLDVSDAVFAIEPNAHCVRAAVDAYMASQRSGTHSTKTRGEVRGGGKKPWRQKGTGRARQGSIRAVQWPGGGIAFGPRPRDYSRRVNRKVRRSAIKSVLSELVRTESLIAIEEFKISEPKTRELAKILKATETKGRRLILTDSVDLNVALSARNLTDADCITADNLNIYDLLTHDVTLATTAAIKRLEEVYA